MAKFLQPDAAEQSRLRGQVEKKERLKKAQDKLTAAERKRKRDLDKERIALLETGIAEAKAKKGTNAVVGVKEDVNGETASSDDIERDEVCNAYLDRDVMLGTSAFQDREAVKQLCGDGTRVFDQISKLWGTKSCQHLPQMINSYLWAPYGVPDFWVDRLLELAAARTTALHKKAEVTNAEKRQETTISPEEAARVAAERAKGERAARIRAWHIEPTEEECARIKFFGLDNYNWLEQTQSMNELGPISGISVEGRVLRWIEAEGYGAQVAYESDARFFDKVLMAKVAEQGRKAGVVRLKALVAQD